MQTYAMYEQKCIILFPLGTIWAGMIATDIVGIPGLPSNGC